MLLMVTPCVLTCILLTHVVTSFTHAEPHSGVVSHSICRLPVRHKPYIDTTYQSRIMQCWETLLFILCLGLPTGETGGRMHVLLILLGSLHQ